MVNIFDSVAVHGVGKKKKNGAYCEAQGEKRAFIVLNVE